MLIRVRPTSQSCQCARDGAQCVGTSEVEPVTLDESQKGSRMLERLVVSCYEGERGRIATLKRRNEHWVAYPVEKLSCRVGIGEL
jgi:hypothetical protein